MAVQKRNHNDGSTKIMCDKCGARGHGPTDRYHRKCKDKNDKGKWRKA